MGRVSGSGVSFYTSTGTGWLAYSGFSNFGINQGYTDINEFPILTGDFNRDGRTDVARVTSTAVKVYVSTGSGFQTYAELPTFSKAQGYLNNKEYPIITGDFNGDGMTDIGRAGDNNVLTYLSTGTGFILGGQISNNLTKNYGCANYNTSPIFTGDFNDDGMTDIGRVKSGSVVIYASTGPGFVLYGSGLADLSPGQGFVDYLEYPLVTGDFDGSGKTGIARASSFGIVFYSPQGEASDLMSQITASSGSITQIEYTPSSAYENTLLPMVLQTVSRIITLDGLGNSATTSYSYSGGLYDYEDRELRSFASAVKTNPDNTTETLLFHQDKFLDGKASQSEFRAQDATLLAKTDTIWDSTPYDDHSSFIRLTTKEETQYENGNQVFRREEFTYDNTHGSLETRIVSGTNFRENITTAYVYDYFGSGLAYPLRTVQETLAGPVTGLVRQIDYTYETTTGNLLTEEVLNTTGDNPVTTYWYDSFGNVISITDPLGNETFFEYDTTINTWPVRIEKPATGLYSHVIQYPSLDYRFGKPLTFENQNNYQTTYTYDEFGRITQVFHPDAGEEHYLYDDISMPRSMTQRIKEGPNAFIETVTYRDGFGRTVQAVSTSKDQYVASLFTFDDMGRQVCVKGPFFTTTNTFLSPDFTGIATDPSAVSSGVTTTWARNYYDDNGRVIRIQQSGDINTYFAHDSLTTRVTDPDGHSKTQVLDTLGRVIEVIEHGPSDQSTLYSYDPAGSLVKVARTNPATGNPIENIVTYNTLGQKIAMTDPDMGHWTYAYDLNGNLVTQTDARNITLTFAYDALNRQTQKTYPDARVGTYTYDGGANGIGFMYEKSNVNADTQYTAYDTRGRLLTETRTIDNSVIVFDKTYDIAGRQASKAVTQNGLLFKTFTYEFYPGTQLLARVKQEDNSALTEITQYSPQGKIEFLNHHNTTVANYIYDYATARLDTIHSYNMSQDIIDKNYTYTKAGDVESIINNRTDITNTYTYDHLHRLVSEESSGAGAVAATSVEVIEFTYEETPGKPVHAPKEIHNNGTLTEYDYTATGNRSFKNEGIESAIYESNDDNMISKITIGGTDTFFFYDVDNKRIKKTQGMSSTLYFGDRFEIINGIPTLYVFAGNLRVAQVTDTSLVYFHKDHLGSTNAMSMEDGTVIDFGEYLPYGLDKSSNDLLQFSPYKFTDQEQDEGTGLYNYDARLYDPVIGQFIMADSMVPDLFNPQSLNRYAYCLNNPLRYVDPTGHDIACGGCHGPYSDFDNNKSTTIAIGFLDIVANVSNMPMLSSVLGIFGFTIALQNKDNIFDQSIYYPVTKLRRTKEVDRVVITMAIPSHPSSTTPQGQIGDVTGSNGGGNDNGMSHGGCINGADIGPNSDSPIAGTEAHYGGENCGFGSSGGNVGPGTSDPGIGNSGSGGSGSKMICVELYRQGLLSEKIFQADENFGRYLSRTNENAMRGYHFWAKPVVKMMRSSKTVTKIVFFFAKPWTEEMAYRMNFLNEGNFWGILLMEIGIPICQLLGFVINCSLSILYFSVSAFFLVIIFLSVLPKTSWRLKLKPQR